MKAYLKRRFPGLTHQVLLSVAFAASIWFCCPQMWAQQRAEGIDSDFQTSAPNWNTVAMDGAYGIQFACIKATALDEGFSNSYFASRMTGAQAAGLYTIPYNRCDPSVYEPQTEAQFFWTWARTNLTAGGYNLSPALDLEDGLTGHYLSDAGGAISLSGWCNEWFDDVSNYAAEAGVHLKQITYVNAGSSCALNGSINGYGWIAWTNCAWPYNSDAEQTGTPWCEGTGCQIYGPGAWTIWQWAWPPETKSPMPGLKERVDQDVFNGTLTQMVSALGTTGTAPVFILAPTNTEVLAGKELVVPAVVFGSPNLGYCWANKTAGTNLAEGSTNGDSFNGTMNATLAVSSVPAGWNNATLELTVTNGWGATNISITLAVTSPELSMDVSSGQLQLSWNEGAMLQSSTNVTGPFNTLAAVPPYVVSFTNARMFYRAIQ